MFYIFLVTYKFNDDPDKVVDQLYQIESTHILDAWSQLLIKIETQLELVLSITPIFYGNKMDYYKKCKTEMSSPYGSIVNNTEI